MHLTDIRINAFGSVRDVNLNRLGRGFTGVYGSNGSGKTTVLQFLRGTFGDRSGTFWKHSHITPSGHIDIQSSDGRREIPIHGEIGPRILSDATAPAPTLAKLSTVTAAEANNTTLVEELAASLGVSLDDTTIDLTTERAAHAKLIADRNAMTARPSGTIAQAEEELQRLEAALAAARAEQARTSERLASQAKALRAAFAATLAQADRAHTNYQHAQTDLTEWQDDAWRPRKSTIEVQQIEVEVDDEPVIRHGATDLRTALLEIAQLRCKASARRADAAAGGPLNLCGNTLAAPMKIADEIRQSLDRLRTAAGTVPAAGLASRVEDLIASLSAQQRAVDWIQADRTRVLLDRCERDLENAALSKCSVCATGSTSCETHVCRTETQSRTTEIFEAPADAQLGYGLDMAKAETYAIWQAALARHRQARRQLDQFDLEIARAAADGRITRLIADRDAAAKRLHDLRLQLDALNESISSLEAILAQDRAPSGPLFDAGNYFQRLTCGHYAGLVRGKSGRAELRAMTATGQNVALQELSRGTQSQAALAMRLSILDALAERGINPPLILDDVLVDSDRDRAAAAINLLTEWSQNRQTLMMTCQRQLIDAMRAGDIQVLSLGSATVSDEPRRATVVAEMMNPKAVASSIAKTSFASTTVKPTQKTVEISAARVLPITQTKTVSSNGSAAAVEKDTYWLDPDSMVVRIPSISETDARRLGSIGIESVEHLVLISLSEVEEDLIELQINPRTFLRWQSEGRLLCLVPGLTARDAQLLAWAGITSAEELAAIETQLLLGRLTALSTNRAASYLKVDAESFSTDRLNRWRAKAGRARSSRTMFTSRPRIRSLRAARQERRRDSDRTSRSTSNRSSSHSSGSSRTTSNGSSDRPRTLSVVERRRAIRRDPQTTGSTSQSTVATTAIAQTTSTISTTDTATEWRYYLETESPVVDAPSIGPKMARRLAKVKIRTVSDLLSADPAAVARGLDDRRIKKQTVIDWQDQARLMCCIPMLRGHDVQVLVACNFRTVEKVSASSPNAMFSIVGPFVKTKDGERLLRSSKVPDLEEVTEWIEFARHARSLKAA